MSRLKPQEVRCLLLRAEGYSYKQICEETGFSYTKVNRCLAEGRKAFLERVAGIESGAECERLAPLLSKLADGEAVAEDLAALRPHLRSCLACRARLREYRGAPKRVAALLPLAAGPHLFGRLLYRLQSLASRAHDQIAHAGDVAAAHKAAAVAAATAALAGGGVAAVQTFEHGGGAGQRAPAAVRPHAQKRAKATAVAAQPTTTIGAVTTRTSKSIAAAPRRQKQTTGVTTAVATRSRSSAPRRRARSTAPSNQPARRPGVAASSGRRRYRSPLQARSHSVSKRE